MEAPETEPVQETKIIITAEKAEETEIPETTLFTSCIGEETFTSCDGGEQQQVMGTTDSPVPNTAGQIEDDHSREEIEAEIPIASPRTSQIPIPTPRSILRKTETSENPEKDL